jgi:hypothetical protein
MKHDILNWFTGCGKAIHDAFARLFGANTASLLLAAQKKIFETALGSFALEVVSDLQSDPGLISCQKASIAGTKIAARAAELGFTIARSEVNLLIELAYAVVRRRP